MKTEVINIRDLDKDTQYALLRHKTIVSNLYPVALVYIGRPSKWGNPYAIGRDGNRAEVIRLYDKWLFRMLEDHNFDWSAIDNEIRGRILVCWCKPLDCHGDVLARYADND